MTAANKRYSQGRSSRVPACLVIGLQRLDMQRPLKTGSFATSATCGHLSKHAALYNMYIGATAIACALRLYDPTVNLKAV